MRFPIKDTMNADAEKDKWRVIAELEKWRIFSFPRRDKGSMLLEAILAMAVAGVMLASGAWFMTRYADEVRIKSAAVFLSDLTRAAESYGKDNFSTLVANAPENIPISALEPYVGSAVGTDAFRTRYEMTTRTYSYSVPDPATGGARNVDALQILVMGYKAPNGPLDDNPSYRVEVANESSVKAGFVSTSSVSCTREDGAVRPAGRLCAAFGGMYLRVSDFGALDLDGDPAVNGDDAVYFGIVVVGDSSLNGDQLHRYDMGDPELNTMRTDLHMSDNDIDGVRNITGVDEVVFDGSGPNRISSSSGNIDIESRGRIRLSADNDRIVIQQNGVNPPKILGQSGVLSLGNANHETIFGNVQTETVTNINGSTRSEDRGTGKVRAGDVYAGAVNAMEINSLNRFSDNDPLRLQNVQNGEVIIGKRARYQPNPGAGGPVYELSDGTLTAQHVRVQDVTCADCGGSLASILPRWRHMGTYFIEDAISAPTGTNVPFPNCGTNRRSVMSGRPSNGSSPPYAETASDDRYYEKIVITPRDIIMEMTADRKPLVGAAVSFSAIRDDALGRWTVVPKVEWIDESLNLNEGRATAFAMTYCVFGGGQRISPANAIYDDLPGKPSASGGTAESWFTRLE